MERKNIYSANSPVDKTKLNYSTTQAILEDIDISDGAAVEKAIEAYKEKRIEEIRNTPTTIKAAEGRKAYYVSNSGNDANDGLTPETAWATPEKASAAELEIGDAVYFRRGDIFRGLLVTQRGVAYSAYGEGEKPRLYGSKRDYAKEEFWDKTETENVYVSKEAFTEDVGLIVFNNGEAWSRKKAARINGTLLEKDLDMYHNTEDNNIYLYSVSDPNSRFDSTEICHYACIVSGNGNDVTIDNLCLKYAGVSGVDYTSGKPANLTVQNCEIGWCGGSLMKAREHDPVRLGNGAGTFNTAISQTATNCYIYQVYDSGLTFQWFNNTTAFRVDMKNIRYTDNVIEYATYGIEYINAQSEEYGIMQDIVFSGNIIANIGAGWGKQRPDRGGSVTAAIKGWGGVNHSSNFLIYDNVIMTKDSYATLIHMCVDNAKNMPRVIGNIFANVRGQKFGLYGEGRHRRDRDMITYDETITDKTVGLDDNTFIFLE